MDIETRGYCSPVGILNHEKYKSCMSFSELVTIGSIYNMLVDKAKSCTDESPSNKKRVRKECNRFDTSGVSIALKKINKSDFTSSSRLIKALNLRFLGVCDANDDQCWIEQPIFKTNANRVYQKLQKHFRPLMPRSWDRDKNQLLNTFDIYKVLKQYEDRYDDFHFLGVYPLDFMEKESNDTCMIGDICHIQMKKHIVSKGNTISRLKLKKRQFIMVHNMDPHDQPGSHWVSLYINIDPSDPRFGFSFYDSYGLPENHQVKKLYANISDQLQELNLKVPPFWRNKKRNQFKNTECGMFSILFGILCLENKIPIPKIAEKLNRPDADDRVADFRQKLFRRI